MAPDYDIRLTGPDDVAALAVLRAHWAAELHGPSPDEGFPAAFAAWHHEETNRRRWWLAVGPTRPIGMVSLALFDRMPAPGRPQSRWGYLANMFVVPERRDHGVGAALLAELLQWSHRQRLARVVLSPSQRSIPFYLRHGFHPAEELLIMTLA
ncbi:MAG TPA: GNAT family N-acetyltransferase [Mycobacteriales bacterium]|nr:GNAT family N-acetyltransferase [Mycobacteriales bacterium]